jgi:hypothetical protein
MRYELAYKNNYATSEMWLIQILLVHTKETYAHIYHDNWDSDFYSKIKDSKVSPEQPHCS